MEKKDKKKFTRVARITGYLVGNINRWNPGKKAELKSRTSHYKSNINKKVVD